MGNLKPIVRSGFADDCARIEAVCGKGLGIVAAKAIPKGARILSELFCLKMLPSLLPNNDVEAAYRNELSKLPLEFQEEFLSLARCRSDNVEVDTGPSAKGIVQDNALPLGLDEVWGQPLAAAVFLLASRFNHSCMPNVHYSWQHKLGSSGPQVFHALRDIAPGEELTISYLGIRGTVDSATNRQERLMSCFKFKCVCSCCVLTGSARLESDSRRKEIDDMVQAVMDNREVVNLERGKYQFERDCRIADRRKQYDLQSARSVIVAVHEEMYGHAEYLFHAYYDAFVLALSSGNAEFADSAIDQATYNAQVACGSSNEFLDMRLYCTIFRGIVQSLGSLPDHERK